MTDKTMQQLCEEMAAAEVAYNQAERAESQARSNACNAKNKLNACQKAVEARMQTMLKNAPADSDWGAKRRRGLEAVA
jgi:hypothetical protein